MHAGLSVRGPRLYAQAFLDTPPEASLYFLRLRGVDLRSQMHWGVAKW